MGDGERRSACAGRPQLIIPSPRISRGKPRHFAPLSAPAPWIALELGPGAERALLCWRAAHGAGAEHTLLRAYSVETSADSRDGSDRTWRTELRVDGNVHAAREHVFHFDGQSWVRLTRLDGAAVPAPEAFGFVEVHDASDGIEDSWAFWGDPWLGGAFNVLELGDERGFDELMHRRYPGYTPVLMHTGPSSSGTPFEERLAQLEHALEIHVECRHWAVTMGIDDARAGVSEVAFAASLGRVLATLTAARRVPVLARIPSLGGCEALCSAYNRVIDAATRAHGLLEGADFEAWFAAHPEQLGPSGELTLGGAVAVHQLWADAVDPSYVPQ